jgi:hypothetical protein
MDSVGPGPGSRSTETQLLSQSRSRSTVALAVGPGPRAGASLGTRPAAVARARAAGDSEDSEARPIRAYQWTRPGRPQLRLESKPGLSTARAARRGAACGQWARARRARRLVRTGSSPAAR